MNDVQYKNQENLDIFIYSHIPFKPITNNHVFKVLTCSHEEASKFNTDLAIYRDYTGVNISDNNMMYNEYCGFYWLWKNYPLKKYVGLNHYRRYYTCYNNLPDFDEIFNKYKIILNEPIPLILGNGLKDKGKLLTNREWYGFWHNIEDFELAEEIINTHFPEYAKGFELMSKANFLHGCNMFTMTREMFTEYCDFIFKALQIFRKERSFLKPEDCVKYVEDNKDKYVKEYLSYYTIQKQARIIGYIAERLLGAYLWSGGDNSLIANSTQFKWGMIKEDMYKV
jgi:hypothetical protein